MKILIAQRQRGHTKPGGPISVWYAPIAKRVVRVKVDYKGGPHTDVTDFGVKAESVIASAPPTSPRSAPVAAARDARAANVVFEHAVSNGIPYTSKRRVKMSLGQYGWVLPFPDFITIDVERWQLR